MAKSPYSLALDEIQKELAPLFKQQGFRKRGRTYNRLTDDGLTQVVNFQMGASDPPGTTYHPGLRENLHGLFAVNLAVYVPEVGEAMGITAKAWVSESFCTMRTRLERRPQERTDTWWRCECSLPVIEDVQAALESSGFPFFETYSDRDAILASIDEETEHHPQTYIRARVIAGIIYARRGETEKAARYLAIHANTAEADGSPGHARYVRGIAKKLGLEL